MTCTKAGEIEERGVLEEGKGFCCWKTENKDKT
jgi:hypothetical protein